MTIARLDFINLYPCDPGFRTEERIQDFDYLLYVHSGKGVFKIGSVNYQASMGDLFYCPPHVGNTIIADETEPFLLSGIDFWAPEYRENLRNRYSLLDHHFLIEMIHEMIREYQYRKIGSNHINNALLSVLLENLQRMTAGTMTGKRDLTTEILDYIASNLHRNITHQELSKSFSYHKNSINRLLIGATGLSLKNYVIELRIKKASELLKYSNKSIGEIGELCGYNSPVFFSRQFREKTGLTPKEYRESVR